MPPQIILNEDDARDSNGILGILSRIGSRAGMAQRPNAAATNAAIGRGVGMLARKYLRHRNPPPVDQPTGMGGSSAPTNATKPNSQPKLTPQTMLYEGADPALQPPQQSAPIPGAKPAPTQQAPQRSGQDGRNPSGQMPITGQSWNTDPTTPTGTASSTIDYPDVNSTINYGDVVDNGGTPDVSSTINYSDIVGPPTTTYGGPQGWQNGDYDSDYWWLGNGMTMPDPTGAYNGTPVVDSTVTYAGGVSDPSNDNRQYYDDYWGDGYGQYDYSEYAKGGIATRPTRALIAEAGEDEYIVPESKLKPFADSVERGKPANPAKLKPGAKPQKGKTRKFAEGGVLDDAALDDEDLNYTPIPASMKPPVLAAPPVRPPMLPMRDDAGDTPPPDEAPPRPPILRAPGAPPVAPAISPKPASATPAAPAVNQPPNPADYQGHGLGRVLRTIGAMGVGALAGASNAKGNAGKIDPTGAQRAIMYPGYQQAKAQYDQQQKAAAVQAEMAKTQAETAHLNSQADYQNAQAEAMRQQGKLKLVPLKDGSLYDPWTHQVINQPKTMAERMDEYRAAGFSDDQARMLAAGQKLTETSTVEVDPAWAQKNAPMIRPDAAGNYRIDRNTLDTIIKGQQEKPDSWQTQHEVDAKGNVWEWRTNPRTGESTEPVMKGKGPIGKPQQQPNPNTQANFDANRSDKSYQYNSGQLEKVATPIEQTIARMGRLQETINQATPQADALIAPELMTVMAGGQGSGLRMNEAEISRVIGGRTNLESLKAALNKWQLDPAKGLSITPAQRQQIRALVKAVNDKLLAKQKIITDAQDSLLNTDDPKEHRTVVTRAKQALASVDQSGGPNSIDPKVKAYADQYFGGDVAKAMAAIEQQRSGKK